MHRRELSKSKVRWVKSHLGLQVPLGSKHPLGLYFWVLPLGKSVGLRLCRLLGPVVKGDLGLFPAGICACICSFCTVPLIPLPCRHCGHGWHNQWSCWPASDSLEGWEGRQSKENICMDHGHRVTMWVWGLLKRVVAENKVLRYSLFPFALEALVNSWVSRGSKVEGAKWEGHSMMYIWETAVASTADSPAELAGMQLALAEEKDWFASCVGFTWLCMLWTNHLGHAACVSVLWGADTLCHCSKACESPWDQAWSGITERQVCLSKSRDSQPNSKETFLPD